MANNGQHLLGKCPTLGVVREHLHCPTCGHTLDPHAEPPDRRILRWLIRKLGAAPEGLTNRELSLAVSSRDRRCLSEVKLFAVQQGIVAIDMATNRYLLAQ